jgi:hypothetical protein
LLEIGTALFAVPLSLLKNLFDHRVRSSATATVGDAQKFVRSRNPVTVIVKIESHEWAGAHMGAAPSNEWKRTDLAEATPRSTIVIA